MRYTRSFGLFLFYCAAQFFVVFAAKNGEYSGMKILMSTIACAALLFAAGCTSSISEYKPYAAEHAKSPFACTYTGFGADKAAIEAAIEKSLGQRGWLVEGRNARGLVAKRVHSDRTAIALITAADNEITIDTAGSTIKNKTAYIPETDISYLLASVKENLK